MWQKAAGVAEVGQGSGGPLRAVGSLLHSMVGAQSAALGLEMLQL